MWFIFCTVKKNPGYIIEKQISFASEWAMEKHSLKKEKAAFGWKLSYDPIEKKSFKYLAFIFILSKI